MQHIVRLPIQLTILLLMAGMAAATAQTVTDAFDCSRQFARIRSRFSDSAHGSFTAIRYIRYNNSQKDTVYYSYKTSRYRVYVTGNDSTETIQDQYYNLALNHSRQKAVWSKAKDPFTLVSQVNILDQEFYKAFVTGRSVTDTGSYKKLSYQFKPASPYKQYDIVYDPTTYRIQYIQYCYGTGSSANPNSRTPFYVTVAFSNYQTGGFTDAVFSTDAYLKRKDNQLTMVAPYENYTLTNSVNQ